MIQDSIHIVKKDSITLVKDSLVVNSPQTVLKKAKITKSVRPPKVVFTSSVFKGHELQKNHSSGLIRDTAREEWLIVLLLLILAIIAYLRVNYYKRFTQLITASFDFQLSNQMVREESVLTQRVSLFLTGIFWVSLPLFCLQVFKIFHFSIFDAGRYGEPLVFLTLFSIVVVVYGIKVFSIRLIGKIFKIEKEMEAYIFNIFLYNKLSGLLLLPLVILIRVMSLDFVKVFFVAGLAILGLSFLARIVRGIFIGLSGKGVSIVHLVLYFCTLEFLPLVLALKFLSQQLG